jgi:hypothetical protein
MSFEGVMGAVGVMLVLSVRGGVEARIGSGP